MFVFYAPTELISLLNDKLKTKSELAEFLTHTTGKVNIQPANNIAVHCSV